jgi:hypothetical protein
VQRGSASEEQFTLLDAMPPQCADSLRCSCTLLSFLSCISLRSAFSDLGSKDSFDKDLSNSSAASSKLSNYASKSPDERRILELIQLLKFHPTKVTAINTFEEWFFDTRPRLSPEFIKLLMQGKNGTEIDGGLIQTIGDITYSHVASRGALYLLCRLLDVEKNKDAHLFLEQFTALDQITLKRMQINQHIISERGNRIGAFKIIQILRNANLGNNGTNVQHTGEYQLESIVNDGWALREYYKWSDRKSDTSGQIVPFNHYETQNKDYIFMKSLNLAPSGGGGGGGGGVGVGSTDTKLVDAKTMEPVDHQEVSTAMKYLRTKISDIFQDIRRLMEEPEVFVTPATPTPAGATPSAAATAAGTTPWRIVAFVTQFDDQNRPILSSGGGGGFGGAASFNNNLGLPPQTESYDEDVSLIYRKNIKQDMVIIKMRCILPYRMEEIAPFLADVSEWAAGSRRNTRQHVRHARAAGVRSYS